MERRGPNATGPGSNPGRETLIACAVSSAGQSGRLLSGVSSVRVRDGALAGWRTEVARLAHNQEVRVQIPVRSQPTVAQPGRAPRGFEPRTRYTCTWKRHPSHGLRVAQPG